MSIPDPLEAVRVFLAANAGVSAQVGTRVYGTELDDSETVNMPRKAIVVKPTGGAGFGTGYMPLGTNNIDVWCFGGGPYEAGEVRLAVYEALKELNRQIANNTLLHWARESGGAVSFRDPDTDWPVQLQTFQVLAAEVATA